MIPEYYISNWAKKVYWKNFDQIEQDLILSRALIELFSHPIIKEKLIFRGGTALNKLYLEPAARYSEDIDLVQKNEEPIGEIIDTIRYILKPWLGSPKWKITERSAKLIFKYLSVSNFEYKLKIEINTTEHFQVEPLKIKNFSIDSEWYTGSSDIVTYSIDELIATKLRALFQRRKGRDLFDLWHVWKNNLINVENVIEIFKSYCAHEDIFISRAQFEQNLYLKSKNSDFRKDMDFLLPLGTNWSFERAYQDIFSEILKFLKGASDAD